MNDYLATVAAVYETAATQPDADLCCTPGALWRLPDLHYPPAMLERNYGCGAALDPRDLRPEDTVVYIGVGGGLEALQLAYFTRRPGSVLAVEPVAAMRDCARANFAEAARLNPWFRPEFITLVEGSALDLPLPDGCATVVAQNCLFNIFTDVDRRQALAEVVRVLWPGGLFATADPITPVPLPAALTADLQARARCLSGCTTFEEYLQALTEAGLGRIEVRRRAPYRYLLPTDYAALAAPVLLESVTLAAYKVPPGPEGCQVFAGRWAIYCGPAAVGDDGQGHRLPRGRPVPISETAAARLAQRKDFLITTPTYHYYGGGCC